VHTNLLKWSLALSVVITLCLSSNSFAQLTTNQLQDWLHSPAATSHVGNLTGHAPDAQYQYRRYCVGCHGADPRPPARCPPTRIFSIRSAAGWTARICLRGIH